MHLDLLSIPHFVSHIQRIGCQPEKKYFEPVAPVAQRYHVTSDTLGRELDPGKRDFSH